ncbi:ATP-binding protein [Bavariicoccus seileri]|uniref:ATP-binding protein n=1 Tax=Bavariicoccus seileri TaxID=549685 RepID=UPI000A0340D0|nr:sensor histidine kinase [Bavariicoccus seileri]
MADMKRTFSRALSRFQKISLRTMTFSLVLITVFFSLLGSTMLMRNYVIDRESRLVRQKISETARIVADDPRVIKAVSEEDYSGVVQEYATFMMNQTNVDFIVVMNRDLIRFSHPIETIIKLPFSNLDDARQALSGEEHYSRQQGVLGDGTRFFTPIYDDESNLIGVVCVGYTQQTVNQQLGKVQQRLFFGLGIGLFIGLIGSFILARQIKKELLGLEPVEIAAQVQEREIVNDAVNEGIIAVRADKTVLLTNKNATRIFEKAQLKDGAIDGEQLNDYVYDLLFRQVFEDNIPIVNKAYVMNQLQLVVSVTPIFINHTVYGAVATLQNRTEVEKLIRELANIEQYVDSLRAQRHNFMNQLHVITGLIELEKYDDVTHFVKVLNRDFHEQIGFLSDKIKSSAMVGFFLGKFNEAKEEGVTLSMDLDSYFPNVEITQFIHSLLISIGVMLDNAYEAVQLSETKEVSFYIHYNSDEKVVALRVSDSGSGMSDTVKQKVFDRGFSTKGPKRGYGLDTLQSIVHDYNGMIELQSQVGKGTTFYVEVYNDLQM